MITGLIQILIALLVPVLAFAPFMLLAEWGYSKIPQAEFHPRAVAPENIWEKLLIFVAGTYFMFFAAMLGFTGLFIFIRLVF